MDNCLIHSFTYILSEHLLYTWVWARGELAKCHHGAHGLVVRAVMGMWCVVGAVLPPSVLWTCALMLRVPHPDNLWMLGTWDTWVLSCLCQ